MTAMNAWQAVHEWMARQTIVQMWADLGMGDRLALAAACVAVFGAMCRVWMLDPRTHKLGALVHAGAMACTANVAAVSILVDGCNLLEAVAVVFVLASLHLTWHTWRHGVPRQFDTRPGALAPLDPLEPITPNQYERVRGGRRTPPPEEL